MDTARRSCVDPRVRSLALVVVMACHFHADTPRPAQLTGHVVDEAGRPIVGAEVLACRREGPCQRVAARAIATGDPLARGLTARDRDFRLTHTGADGSWRLVDPRDPNEWNAALDVVITAPGREVSNHGAYVTPSFPEPIELAPAFALDIAAHCGDAACADVGVGFQPNRLSGGSHIGRVPRGPYTVSVSSRGGKPGEMRGEMTVDLSTGPQRVELDLHRTGTGLSIRGTVVAEHKGRTTVSAECSDVRRSTTADDHGEFELEDVGLPPCTVDAILDYESVCYDCGRPDNHESRVDRVFVDELPATIVLHPSHGEFPRRRQ
jgi:hypothetical protein